MSELDLQEQTRRDDVFNELMEINIHLSQLPVFPSLLWAWTFDVIKDIFDNNQYIHLAENDYADEAVPQDITLKQIFDKFWDDVDTLGFTMDHGGEVLEETIRDWMRENDFLVALDDDRWLDLTDEEGSDTINTNQLQKGNTMQHEHYWDTPSDKALVAECACGEQLERVQD
jgi:hypothetical protein